MKYREKLLNDGASKQTIEQEIMYRPIKPSEAFLISSGNIFPRIQLQNHLSFIENNDHLRNRGQSGAFSFGNNGQLIWKIDRSLRSIDNFPLRRNDDTNGCIKIWEHPYLDVNGNIPRGLYIAGCDPIDQEKGENKPSLFSMYIYKRFFKLEENYDFIVAEYTARPEMPEECYENSRKLLMYYNAVCLYENMIKGFYVYMKQKKSTHLLADSPDIIHDIIKDSKVERGKGIHAAVPIRDWCERLARSWLIDEYAPGKQNLTKILSVGLLKELISYDNEGNFDRVDAFFLTLLYNQELHHVIVKEKAEISRMQDLIPSKLFTNKPNLLNAY